MQRPDQPAPTGNDDVRLTTVGQGPSFHSTDISSYWRRKIAALYPGDKVHVLLDDGRIIEGVIRGLRLPITDRCCVWVHGIRGSYAAGRIRTPGGWRRLLVKP